MFLLIRLLDHIIAYNTQLVGELYSTGIVFQFSDFLILSRFILFAVAIQWG